MKSCLSRPTPLALVGVCALSMSGCPSEPEIIPGIQKSLTLRTRLAAIPEATKNTIGSFGLELLRDNEVLASTVLNFNTASGELSLLEELEDLPVTGRVRAELVAFDLVGGRVAVGGRSQTIDLDQVEDGGSAALLALVGRLDAPTPLLETLRAARTGAMAAAWPTGFVVVGGRISAGGPLVTNPVVEWMDMDTGQICPGGVGCDDGDSPSARAGGFAVSLGEVFDARCAHKDKILVGGGETSFGTSGELWLFDPTILGRGPAFTKLDVLMTPRTRATAIAARACAVVVAGGHDGAAEVDTVEVLRFQADGSVVVVPAAGLPTAVMAPGVHATRNALDEIVFVGGEAADALLAGGAVYAVSDAGVAACDLQDRDCNGEAAALSCGRAPVVASVLGAGGTLGAVVVGGGADDCAAQAEFLRVGDEAPFARAVPLSAQPTVARQGGHVALPFGGGVAVLGGRDADGPVAAVEAFTIDDADGATASGSWRTLPPLSSPRTDAAAFSLLGNVVLVGGHAAAASSAIEILIPESP
jgi:hypothetical protein